MLKKKKKTKKRMTTRKRKEMLKKKRERKMLRMKTMKWRKKTFQRVKHVDSCGDAQRRSLRCRTDGDVSADDH